MLSKFDTDLGTPKRESAQSVTLTIDSTEITVPAGTSVMQGREAGFYALREE